jgi:chemotaxis protein methyltransferase CheR
MNSGDLIPFQTLVHRRSGLQLDTLPESGLMLAVHQRMSATKADLPSAYYTHLLGDDAEFDELVSLLTINETYFFREPKQLELLTERLLPTLLAGAGELPLRPLRPLRILSAGCSTGEEPYSIAMAIRNRFGECANRLVAITACDIDRHALRRARLAHYSEYSFRAAPQGLRERYFTALPEGGYRLDETIRTMVEFHSFNLLASQLPVWLADFDVVFFRNVSIYFDAPSRERIQRTLHAVMRETGYLVLGTAETLANDLGVFELRDDQQRFYFVKSGPEPTPVARAVRRAAIAVLPRKSAPVALARTAERVPDPPMAPALTSIPSERIDAVRALVRAGRYGEALQQLMPLRGAAPDHVDGLLLESYALLQSHRFAEAAALARRVLERDSWSVDAMMLLGFAAKWQDDSAAAIDHFRTAAYIRPDCWPAHYYLGGLLHEGQAAKAGREYRTVLMQLTTNPDPDGGLRLPLDLPVADIRFLCERRGAASESH